MGNAFKYRSHYKNYAPTNYAGFYRQLLLRFGYRIFEVDEYNTSKLCNCCHQELDYARGYNERGELIYNYRLMRCHNRECRVGWIDRDLNAAINIAKVGIGILKERKPPPEFRRPPKWPN